MSIPSRPSPYRLAPSSPAVLPDFRNQGVWLRLLLAVNALLLVLALLGSRGAAQFPLAAADLALHIEPTLLLVLALLYLLAAPLRRLRPVPGVLAVVGVTMAVYAGLDALLAWAFGAPGRGWRAPLESGLAAAGLLYWLALRARAHAPALAEARLSALTARIRPHFFFNSLNAVLGILREDPRRAEAALEELAELFRAVMRDGRELVPLSEEIALARKYLDIERLRLGERLQVRWEVADCPPDAQAPALLLQPLLENAVYHGVEPADAPGEIHVRIAATRDGVRIEIDNPCPAEGGERHGNRMALDNLRERLLLFYDLEARLATRTEAGRFAVRLDLPVRRSA